MSDDIAARIAKQNAEFDAAKELAKQYRRIELTPVVDDDYPSVRFDYERAVRAFIEASQANGRFAQSESAPIVKGWAIQHDDRKRWRTMDTIGMPDWTDDKAKALVCRLKYHIERYAEDDPDDIRIVEVDW